MSQTTRGVISPISLGWGGLGLGMISRTAALPGQILRRSKLGHDDPSALALWVLSVQGRHCVTQLIGMQNLRVGCHQHPPPKNHIPGGKKSPRREDEDRLRSDHSISGLDGRGLYIYFEYFNY